MLKTHGKLFSFTDTKISSVGFVAVAVFVFAVIFGPAIYAEFARQTGNPGWGNGYGYGFGYGYGWEGGQFAGYRGGAASGSSYDLTEVSYDPYTINDGTNITWDEDSVDDQFSDEVSLPFIFNFYGTGYESFRLSSNGVVSFNQDNASYPGQFIPTDDSANGLIAFAWEDMHVELVDHPNGNTITQYQTFGDAPNRVFVISVQNLYCHCEHDPSDVPMYSGQIWLREGSNIIEEHNDFLDFSTASGPQTVTQGVENQSGSAATPVPGLNESLINSLVQDNVALRFTPGSSGLPSHTVANPNQDLYGFGYGFYVPKPTNPLLGSFNSELGQFEISAAQMPLLVQAGLLIPDGSSPEDTHSVTFDGKIKVSLGNSFMIIPNETTFSANCPCNTTFSTLAAGLPDIDVGDFHDQADTAQTPVASLGMGLPELGLSVSPSVEFHIFLGASYNGKELDVYMREPDSDWNDSSFTDCVITGGYCTFSTSSLTDFAVVASPPSVETTSAISTGPNSERLRGTITDLGNGGQNATQVAVQFGLTTEYTNTEQTNGSFPLGGYDINIAGLTCGTIYHYRAFITNSGGSAYGEDDLFLTGSCSGGAGNTGGGGGGGNTNNNTNTNTNTNTNNNTNTPSHDNVENPPPPPGTMNRDEANRNLPGDTPVDTLIMTRGVDTVYYVGLDAKRHPFINPTAYFTWYDSFDGVLFVSSATLASIPLGTPVLARPGTHWVKIVSDPKTYFVEPGSYRLRWIKDQNVALVLGGPNWNTNIIDVDTGYFANYVVGDDITLTYLAAHWPRAALVRATEAGPIYYVSGSTRRLVDGVSAFAANHFQNRFVETSNAPGWQSLPVGTVINAQDDYVFSLSH